MDTASSISAQSRSAAPQPIDPQPVAAESEPEAPAALRRCRSINPDGHQCPDPALRGEDHCYAHRRDRRREAELRLSPAVIEVPALDSHAAIQSVATEVARALAAGTIDAAAVRGFQTMLAIAIRTLPRPAGRTAAPAKSAAASASSGLGRAGSSTGSRSTATRSVVSNAAKSSSAGSPASASNSQPAQSRAEDSIPVTEIVITPLGEELAPDIPYYTPEAAPERVWSFAEYLYRTAHPERANEPLPEGGYIDPEKGSCIPDPNLMEPFVPAANEAASTNPVSLNPVSKESAGKEPVSEDQAGEDSASLAPYASPSSHHEINQPIAGILPEVNAVSFILRRSCGERFGKMPSRCGL